MVLLFYQNFELCTLWFSHCLATLFTPDTKESVQTPVVPVSDTHEEPYVLKGLSGQSRVSWLLVKWLSTLLLICCLSFPTNYSPNDGPRALNTEKLSAGRPDFPPLLPVPDITPHPNPRPILLWNTPRLQNPRRGVMLRASRCRRDGQFL